MGLKTRTIVSGAEAKALMRLKEAWNEIEEGLTAWELVAVLNRFHHSELQVVAKYELRAERGEE